MPENPYRPEYEVEYYERPARPGALFDPKALAEDLGFLPPAPPTAAERRMEHRMDLLEQKLDKVLSHLEGRIVHVPGIGYGHILGGAV